MSESVTTSAWAWLRSWDLWHHTSPGGVAWILGVELLVGAWTVLTLASTAAPTANQYRLGAFLLAGAAWHLGRTRRDEERRRAHRLNAEHVDHSGIWHVGAALLLPLPFAMVILASIRLHRWFRARKPPGRFLFTTSAILASILACHTTAAASPVLDWLRQPGHAPTDAVGSMHALATLAAAAAAYYLAQTLIISIARALRPSAPLTRGDTPPTLTTRLIGTWADNRELLLTFLAGVGLAFAAALLWGLPILVVAIVAAVWTRSVQQADLLARERQRDAHTDPKTNLLNHAGWSAQATAAIRLDEATGQSSAVLMIDGDGIKKINDTHGHLIGDIVIRKMGDKIRQAVRATAPQHDLVARWGGDEFAVYLTGDADGARLAAKRILTDIKATTITAPASAGAKPVQIRIGVSIGAAVLTAAEMASLDDPLGHLEHHADRMLYIAKNAGRGRVELTQHTTPSFIPHQTHAREAEPHTV